MDELLKSVIDDVDKKRRELDAQNIIIGDVMGRQILEVVNANAVRGARLKACELDLAVAIEDNPQFMIRFNYTVEISGHAIRQAINLPNGEGEIVRVPIVREPGCLDKIINWLRKKIERGGT